MRPALFSGAPRQRTSGLPLASHPHLVTFPDPQVASQSANEGHRLPFPVPVEEGLDDVESPLDVVLAVDVDVVPPFDVDVEVVLPVEVDVDVVTVLLFPYANAGPTKNC